MNALRILALAAAAAVAGQAAHAQAPAPIAPMFLTGVKACIAIQTGALALNPPSANIDAAGLVLADPAGADDTAPFKDLSPSARNFAAVSGPMDLSVVVAQDPTQNLCRVAVLQTSGLSSIAPITAQMGGLTGDWAMVSDDPVANYAVYTGTLLGSPKMTFSVRKPSPGTGYGSGLYMLTMTSQD